MTPIPRHSELDSESSQVEIQRLTLILREI